MYIALVLSKLHSIVQIASVRLSVLTVIYFCVYNVHSFPVLGCRVAVPAARTLLASPRNASSQNYLQNTGMYICVQRVFHCRSYLQNQVVRVFHYRLPRNEGLCI